MQFNCIKMRYSIEPKHFLIALKNEKKLRKAIQKTAEATGDLIGKLKLQIKEQVCRKSLLRSTQWNCIHKMMLIVKYKYQKRYISPEERQHIIDELRSIPKKNVYF